MELNSFRVEPVRYITARPFIEKLHYSHNTNGIAINYCFGLFSPRPEFFNIPEMIGACMYGFPSMNRQAMKWAPSNPKKCIELRRLVCIDDTPKNTESFFISKTLKWLKKNTDIEVVLSYADPMYGHTGIIYKASNFELVGRSAPGKILVIDGKRYHDRTLRNPKPYSKLLVERLKAKDPNIKWLETPSKYIYRYIL